MNVSPTWRARPLRILVAAPAYWPAHAFGGPVVAARELVRRLVDRGHVVDVVTTTLLDVGGAASRRTRVDAVDGATVTTSARRCATAGWGSRRRCPRTLRDLERPDVVHVARLPRPGDDLDVAGGARRSGIPYVFEPLGMFEPRLRKVALKRALDATLVDGVARDAAAVVIVSELEAADVIAARDPS